MDPVQVERETKMLQLLASMVDGFNAYKFFTAHKYKVGQGKCDACAMAMVSALVEGMNDEQGLMQFRDSLCKEMGEAVDQIVAAERIARDVGRAIDEAAKKFKAPSN